MIYTFQHGDQPLAGFTIQRAVGYGGFGEVYYAVTDGGRDVALKYLRENAEIELRGVSQCMNLKSPHLVCVIDVKKNEHGEYFVVTEYISGPTIRDLLVANPQGLGTAKAAYLLGQIGNGLVHLHDRGIVHRDMKPGNIFYDEGYVKIGDYGLSKYISVSRHSGLTSSVGTVHYMAPEVGSGNYDKTIDIYALGVILYELLLGRVPYEGSSMGEVLMKHLTAQPEVDMLPEPFANVIRKALAKDPSDRFQDVREMTELVLGRDAIARSLVGFRPMSLTEGLNWNDRVVEQPSPRRRPRAASPIPVQQQTQQSPRRTWNSATGVLPMSPEALTGKLEYAGFWIRAGAVLIDAAVVGAVAGVLALMFGWRGGENPFFLLLSIPYQTYMIARWEGQTLGKRACGVRIISATGRYCSMQQALARTLTKILSGILLAIGYLMIAFDDKRRGLHDRFASTLAVRTAVSREAEFGNRMTLTA